MEAIKTLGIFWALVNEPPPLDEAGRLCMKKALHILNLEDNPNDTELIQTKLEEDEIECEITRVETEQEFVTAVEQGGFDLILADYKLPSFDGLTALAIAQGKSPEVPFIIISGTLGEDLAVETLKKGAADYVLKDKLFRLGPAVRRALEEVEKRIEYNKTAEALQESMESYRVLFDQDPLPGWIYDTETYRFLMVNQAALKHYGYTLEEFLSMTIKDIRPSEDIARLEKFSGGIKDQPAVSGLWKHRKKDGTFIDVEINSHPVMFGGRKARRVIVRDVTEQKRADKALWETSQLNREMIECAQEGIIVYGPDLKYQVWNPFMERLTGIPAADVLGRHPLEIFPFLRETGVFVAIEKALKGETIEPARFPFHIPKTGRSGWTSDISAPFRNADGEIIGVIATVRDVSQHVLAEEALRESEKRYHILFDQSPDGILLIDPEGNILEFNEMAHRQLGYSREEFARLCLADLDPVESQEEIQGKIRKILEMGKTAFDVKHRTKQGEIRDVFIINQAMMLSGSPVVYTIWRDITYRKRAEEDLRRSERRYKDLFDSTLDGIYQLDADGVFILMNHAGARIFGYESPVEIIGRNIIEYWREPKDRDLLISELKSKKSVSAYPIGARRKDGEPIELESSSTIIEDEKGNVLGIGGILRDVTERKQTEERISRQIQKLASLRTIELSISSSLDLRVILKIFIDHVVTQLGVDAANVLLLNPNTKALEYAASQGFRTSALRHSHLLIGEGYAGVAVLENRIVKIPNLKEDSGFTRSPLLKGEDFIAYYGVPLVAKGYVKGVLEVFHRSPLDPDEEWFDFLDALALQAAIAIDNNSLFYELERSNMGLMLAYDSTIEGWSRALDYRDKETEGHSQRVTELTINIARELGMNEEELVHMRRGALLHDIGKMGIPDKILLKPGPLTEEEWKIMRLHPVYAYELLHPIDYLRASLDIPYCHHENWNGSGYPRGLKGEQIPLSARTFAVVDVWDALRSDRPYRRAWTEEKAKEYIGSLSGIQFDPKVVEAFIRAIAEKKD